MNHLIQDLAVVMTVAGLVTVLFRKLKQPVVLGYILAGFLIGPHSPPFSYISSDETIHTLADLGIILLMFSLGLHFNLKKIREVGLSALIAAFLEIVFMVWIGFEVGHFFGWSDINSIFLGAILSISSTTIIVKALHEMGLQEEKFASLIFGILIMEDLLGIAMIALLSSMAQTGSIGFVDVVGILARLAIFLTVTLVMGLLAVPPFLRFVNRFRSRETMLISILGLCFASSLLALKLGYSVALGAFMMGAIISEVKEIERIDNLVEPVKDMFSAIFFVAVGLLINPSLLMQHLGPIAVITVAVIFGKIITCAFGTYIAGHDVNTSLKVGMGLAQIGEFSFIIAALGLTLHVTGDFLYPIAVTVSVMTTLTTPYLIRSSDFWVATFDRLAPPKVLDFLNQYNIRVEKLKQARFQKEGEVRWRKAGVAQIAINLVLITAIFFVANFMAENAAQFLPEDVLKWAVDWNNPCWFLAMTFSSPLMLVTFRTLYKMGGVSFLFPGIIGIGVLILLLSATMFPQGYVVFVLTAIALATSVVFWRFHLQVYGKAKDRIRKTLS